MRPTMGPVDWSSKNSDTFLNPRWDKKDHKVLLELSKKFSRPGHIWIATSGSTAESNAHVKLVALSKPAFLCSAEAVNQHLQATSQDVWGHVLPDFHVGGLSIYARASLLGNKVYKLLAPDDKWDAQSFYKWVSECRVSLSALVPAQVYDLVSLGLQAPGCLRAIVVGGGALQYDLWLRARQLGWPVLTSFGMTECCSQIATSDMQSLEKKMEPEMKILQHVQAKLSDEGRVMIKSDALFTGYAFNQNAEAKFLDPKQDGWFTSEDRAELQHNSVKVLGRDSDFVKIGGENVSLKKLKDLFSDILQAKGFYGKAEIMAVPDTRLGTVIWMASTLDVLQSEKLMDEFDQRVLPYERIREIRYIASIPRTDLGKVKLKELLALVNQ